jgi:protein phosphatase PTC7
VANLGDSGFLVLRSGSVVLRSSEQTHFFNCPFQLSLPTPGFQSISDLPSVADNYKFNVLPGDMIVTGSDGLFDNLSDTVIRDILLDLTVENFEEKLEEICQICISVALDENVLSPFALEARRHGYKKETGGKMDDLTVIINILI